MACFENDMFEFLEEDNFKSEVFHNISHNTDTNSSAEEQVKRLQERISNDENAFRCLSGKSKSLLKKLNSKISHTKKRKLCQQLMVEEDKNAQKELLERLEKRPLNEENAFEKPSKKAKSSDKKKHINAKSSAKEKPLNGHQKLSSNREIALQGPAKKGKSQSKKNKSAIVEEINQWSSAKEGPLKEDQNLSSNGEVALEVPSKKKKSQAKKNKSVISKEIDLRAEEETLCQPQELSINDGNATRDSPKKKKSGLKKKKLGLKKKKSSDTLIEMTKNLEESIPKISIHSIENVESCTHEVAIPPDQFYIPLEPTNRKPAKTYPFTLDAFQKESILCIENNQSVLVSAHTSAGKTVIGEYAIAKCLNNNQKVIYTTPIKALSNQKYRDFKVDFEETDVGLMTGDVTINPNASCLIMTTEILRSMLYNGSEVTREVGWVVFDEIHYMRDKTRGYIWEETLILLPSTVHFVFLSATIPNANQFAQWICHLHQQPCHVIYTDFRPTPLKHHIYPAGSDSVHLVVDELCVFKEDNFNMAMESLQNAPDVENNRGRKGSIMEAAATDCFKLVKMMVLKSAAPIIIFSFSKKECEAYALHLSSKLDLTKIAQKPLVDEIFTNAMAGLSEEERQLPQIKFLQPLLRRGIGVHHGGLLPILKEIVEILFGEGLLLALFATETFAMGLNMPARVVIFTSVRKFDGADFRWITSGEYIQMSGRAGRRGKDVDGIVLMIINKNINNAVTKNLVQGQADPINSAFHLTYNMVLNLMRVEEINPEHILERSFFQFQNFASLPGIYNRITECENKLNEVTIKEELLVESYYKLQQTILSLNEERSSYLTKPVYIVPYLTPGRLLKVQIGELDFGWVPLLSYRKIIQKNPLEDPIIIVNVLLIVKKETAFNENINELLPPVDGEDPEPFEVPITLNLIQDVSAVRIKFQEELDLSPYMRKQLAMAITKEVEKRIGSMNMPCNPVTHLKIRDPKFLEVLEKINKFKTRLNSHKLHSHPERDQLCAEYENKIKLEKDLEDARTDLKKVKTILHLDELKCRKRVLRRLGYANSQDVIEIKGRVACELSSADELLLTEMIFNGLFKDLTVPQCCAILSTFVCDEKSSKMPILDETLSSLLRQMQEIARRIAKVCHECKLDVNEEEYVDNFKPYLINVVHDWCSGSTFSEVCKKTDIFEGSIIRALRRLEELLRQMVQASKVIGIDLENKFLEGAELIKRDIVFAASLYV